MPPSDLVVTEVQGVTTVSFRNPSILDAHAIDTIGEELYALVDRQAKRKVLLDFSQVNFLSSKMMGVLLALHGKAAKIKGKVVICSLQPNLFEAFRIMQLDKLLSFAKTEADGLGKLAET